MNAHATIRRPKAGSPTPVAGEPITLDNDGLYIPPEKLARFGNGDVVRGRAELRLLIEAENDRTVRQGPVVRPPNVRIATPADEQAVLELLLIDVKENAERIAVVNPERILAQIQHATNLQGSVCAVIDGPDKRPVAVALLAPYQWWWSTERFYQEVVNFVHPDHRKSRYIHDLIAFERWWGDEMSKGFGHRVYVLMGVLGTQRVREKTILYRRKMRQVGAAFMWPCPFGDDVKVT